MNVARALSPDFDSAHFRSALSQFATGVTVITTRAPDGSLVGLTANSFNSVSLDPPLILWSLALRAGSLPVFRTNRHYAVNVLSAEQEGLARRFAGAREHRFKGLDFREGAGGAPVLEGCAAWFECFNRSHYDEGDHVIFVGQVERCGVEPRPPLIFHQGRFCVSLPLVPDAAPARRDDLRPRAGGSEAPGD